MLVQRLCLLKPAPTPTFNPRFQVEPGNVSTEALPPQKWRQSLLDGVPRREPWNEGNRDHCAKVSNS